MEFDKTGINPGFTTKPTQVKNSGFSIFHKDPTPQDEKFWSRGLAHQLIQGVTNYVVAVLLIVVCRLFQEGLSQDTLSGILSSNELAYAGCLTITTYSMDYFMHLNLDGLSTTQYFMNSLLVGVSILFMALSYAYNIACQLQVMNGNISHLQDVFKSLNQNKTQYGWAWVLIPLGLLLIQRFAIYMNRKNAQK